MKTLKTPGKQTIRWMLLSAIIATALLAQACKGMYDNIGPYAGEEVVYPGRYDTIVAHIGFERVELDLMKAGRVPSDQINLGKANRTVVEYDDQQIVINSLVSWVEVRNLTLPKLYRIRVYAEDEHGNRSVPQEIAVIPYTAANVQSLAVASPRMLTSPNAAVLDWPTALSSILLDYQDLSFEYVDRDGNTVTGTRGANPRIFLTNLMPGQAAEVKLAYRVRPKVGNQPILDVVELERTLAIDMPTGSTPFSPAEKDVLEANGVSIFTADGVASVTKLTYPLHANTLQDLFYFPNVEEVDLTGGTIFEMTSLAYNRNGASSTVGGGSFPTFVRHVDRISDANAQPLVDLLESGQITKVRYVPNSLGIDQLLLPYDAQGRIEWVSLPNESPVSMTRFFVDGRVQDNAWNLDYVIPATDAPAGNGIEEPIKVTLKAKNASFALILPTEYRFNTDEYRYLKFKVYMPPKVQLSGAYDPYQRLWLRFMNYMWSFPGESTFGQQYWDYGWDDFRVPDSELQKWHDVTVDLSPAANRHTRVIVVNIGGEPSVTFAPPQDMVYYFSNFRFAK